MIRVKRVYDAPERTDGKRFLVDRLWPRGKSRPALSIENWLKELAPSHELRRWFGHDPDRWNEFKSRYFAELEDKEALWEPLLKAARRGSITLLYSARDPDYNQAVALKSYLDRKAARRRASKR